MSAGNELPTTTHGRQASPVAGFALSGDVQSFECPLWPECGCPGGTVHPDCPARGGDIEDDGFITIYPPIGGVA
ncbi:hypothetical protein [uncultured Tateyamaria sp.]|uniref:hypothetical protein n=1 Tax=uncultured Tateyamaria sp. TaxID=455651 RepID=UPI00261E0B1C|nr:hypothetical protein [uncultured Tateyamaria sp.]